MKKYDAFISYRKTHVAYADLIYSSLVSEGINGNRIFQDKHDIGPELFDEKIKAAIEQSNSLILIVSKDCFIRKDGEDEDWYLREIKEAISSNIPIIPVLFDSILTLEDKQIIPLLEKEFPATSVEILTHQQAIRYDSDYSDASLSKVYRFVDQAAKKENLTTLEKTSKKTINAAKVAGALFAGIILFLMIFFSIGFFVGYVSTPNDIDKIINKYTRQYVGNAVFEVEGLTATYDTSSGKIAIDDESFEKINPKEIGFVKFSKAALVSFSFTSSLRSLGRSFKVLEYATKYARNKAGKMAVVAGYAGVAIGTLLGANQGFAFGKRMKLEVLHEELLHKLRMPETWQKSISLFPSVEKFGGIGVQFKVNEDSTALIITNVFDNGPADISGVLEGDKITQINDSAISEITEDFTSIIRGEEGTSVTITIERDGKSEIIEIVRKIIDPLQVGDMSEDSDSTNQSSLVDDRLISNPAAIIMMPVDTTCFAHRKGITSPIILLSYSSWNIKKEMEQQTMHDLYVSEDGSLPCTQRVIYGYWTVPNNTLEMPQFNIEYLEPEQDLHGFRWSINVFPRNDYDKYKEMFIEWEESNISK